MPKLYSKVSDELWADEKFLKLSAIKPSGQSLWLYLLLGPFRTRVPGILMNCGFGAFSDRLGWPVATVRKHWQEIASLGMAKADWHAGVVWLPNAIVHNEPESPNVVSYWRHCLSLVPRCDLLSTAERQLLQHLEKMGPEWIEAWQMAPEDRARDARLRRWLRTNPELRKSIKTRDCDRCRYCGRVVSWSDRRGPLAGSYDHVDPNGGNDILNVVTACRSCNSRKGRRTPAQAGMELLLPGSGPRFGTGSGPEKPRHQEQDQDQDTEEVPPNPLQSQGDSIRVSTRKPSEHELEQARNIYKSSGCRHSPSCQSGNECVGRLVQEQRIRVARGQQSAMEQTH